MTSLSRILKLFPLLLFERVMDDRFEMFECSLYQRSLLVRCVTVTVDKIAAHPTDLTELLIGVPAEDVKVGGINESVATPVDLILRVWM